VLGYASMRDGSEDSSAPEPREVHRIVGEEAPRFAVDTLDGGRFDLAQFSGRPVWINVWATWCPPCRVEMPDIDEFLRTNPDLNLTFLAMNLGEPRGQVESYVANTKYGFRIGLDAGGNFTNLYGVGGLPTHIFIDASGHVQSVRVGSMTRDEMMAKARELAAGAQAVPAADGTRGSAPAARQGAPH
jgi:thiol-disulfide isomerase/thioredoxin